MTYGALKIKGEPEKIIKFMEEKLKGPFGHPLFMKNGASYILMSEQSFLLEGTNIYIKPEYIRLKKLKNQTRVVACEFHKDGEFTGKELLGYPEFVFTAYIFEDGKCVRQVVVEYNKIISDRKENFR